MLKNITAKIFIIICCCSFFSPAVFATFGFNKAADSQEIKKIKPIKTPLITSDKFKLISDYYAGQALKGGVLLLHDCDADRRSYKNLAEKLTTSGLHVLNLDFRGFGDSINEKVSHLLIRKRVKNIRDYQTAMTSLTSFWKNDSLLAFQWLRNKVDKTKQIAIVSAGCSANYAVSIAEKMHINSFVFVTPKMDYGEKERYKNVPDSPSYFISSAHQLQSYKTSKELFEWNGSRNTKEQIFKDKRIGHSLLNHQIGLAEDITNWLTRNLK